jgi:spore coat polysaccharide biosynthesis protein SpsF
VTATPRRLVVALACRINGSRLYGKPLQLLDIAGRVSVLDHMITMLTSEPAIAEVVLGVADAGVNEVFHDVAAARGIRSIRGDERDVLGRLIQCADAGQATDVFRVTSESPFTYMEAVADAWQRHVQHGNDVTVTDGLPDGANFEIFTREALERSHANGDARHRSELCSLYIREHRDQFQVEIVPTPASLQRPLLRLTIDYPEDLIVCRAVYDALRETAPRLPLARIIQVLDQRPDLSALVAPFASPSWLYTREHLS